MLAIQCIVAFCKYSISGFYWRWSRAMFWYLVFYGKDLAQAKP